MPLQEPAVKGVRKQSTTNRHGVATLVGGAGVALQDRMDFRGRPGLGRRMVRLQRWQGWHLDMWVRSFHSKNLLDTELEDTALNLGRSINDPNYNFVYTTRKIM